LKSPIPLTDLTTKIGDYEIIRNCGGVEDISYMFLAKHSPSALLVSLKLTDLDLSQDYEFIEEAMVNI
jgi:hypothetical protein